MSGSELFATCWLLQALDAARTVAPGSAPDALVVGAIAAGVLATVAAAAGVVRLWRGFAREFDQHAELEDDCDVS